MIYLITAIKKYPMQPTLFHLLTANVNPDTGMISGVKEEWVRLKRSPTMNYGYSFKLMRSVIEPNAEIQYLRSTSETLKKIKPRSSLLMPTSSGEISPMGSLD